MAVTWQTPEFAHKDRTKLVTILVPATDPDFVALMADGYCEIDVLPRPSWLALVELLLDANRVIRAELATLPKGAALDASAAADSQRFYFWGAMRLPDEKQFAVTVGSEPCSEEASLVPQAVRVQAGRLVAEHRARQAVRAAQAVLSEITDQPSLENPNATELERSQSSFEPATGMGMAHGDATLLAPESLLKQLPFGLAVPLRSADPGSIERLALSAIRAASLSSHPPPKDGSYECVVTGRRQGKRLMALITWKPHRGLPPYAEIRAAAERRLPRAFPSPRMAKVQRPHVSDMSEVLSNTDTSQINASSFDTLNPEWLEAFDGRSEFDFSRRAEMAATARGALQQQGFEAIAWYQPHHLYIDQAWGIYVDAAKLDELTCSLSEDLRREGIFGNTDALAAKLAVGLVLEHEQFHAKVEAALTWIELQAGHPKYVRYQRDVYAISRGTPALLEEALANFWAWSWFTTESILASLEGALTQTQRESMNRVVEGVLDLSPPGYRHWRQGREGETWRILATQAAHGRQALPPPRIGLPLEPLLRDPLAFDYSAADVPLRFVGFGHVAHRLFSSPATLNRPSRRELRSAITRHFGYTHVPGGKGSHEKFRGADGRMFPLPLRDPVSQEVFGTFLEHFSLTKTDYVHKVRPTL